MQVERSAFYKPEEILNQVEQRIKKVRNVGESIDYLTFVSDGEPTLDINLGVEIELLRQFEIKIAVITNASLIWLQDVRQELAKANWVSLKIDSTCEEIWRQFWMAYLSLQKCTMVNWLQRPDRPLFDRWHEKHIVTFGPESSCFKRHGGFFDETREEKERRTFKNLRFRRGFFERLPLVAM